MGSQSTGFESPDTDLASGAIRAAAWFIDAVVLLIVFIVFLVAFGGTTSNASGGISHTLNNGPLLLYWAVCFLYFIILEASFGGTLGKLSLGLRVVDEDGDPIGIGKSIGRNLLRLIDGFPYIIPNLVGLIILSSTRNRQRLGDIAVKSLVIRRS